MALIKTIKPDEATGSLAEIYEALKQNMNGFVPSAFQLKSLSPELVEVQSKFLKYYLQHPTLSGKLTAFIRLLVSVRCGGDYCKNINSWILSQVGIKPEEIEAAKADPQTAPLDDKDKTMLLFCLKVVKDAHTITEADLGNLRTKGWTDKDILDAANHATAQVAGVMLMNALKIDPDI